MSRPWCNQGFRLPSVGGRAAWRPARRLYDSVPNARAISSVETLQVACGSSGHVTMRIHEPTTTTTGRRRHPLIIHLPPLGTESDDTQHVPVPSALLPYTVVQIYARWSRKHLFPTPVHDALRAYSWIVENVARREPHGSRDRPMAIYGQGLGGSLAAALALTESRLPQGSRRPDICALAVKDALFDWSRIASSAPPPPPPSSPPPPPRDPHSLTALHALCSQLFNSPAAAFDAFASPLLFFRTTGLAVPAAFIPRAPSSSSLLSLLSSSSSSSSSAPKEAALDGSFVARKSHLTFPPKNSNLRIPSTRIGISPARGAQPQARGKVKKKRGQSGGLEREQEVRDGDDGMDVLRDQAAEMVKLMRRSVMLHEAKERHHGAIDAVTEAERRVALVELPTLGDGEADDAEWAAEFFEDILDRENDEQW